MCRHIFAICFNLSKYPRLLRLISISIASRLLLRRSKYIFILFTGWNTEIKFICIFSKLELILSQSNADQFNRGSVVEMFVRFQNVFVDSDWDRVGVRHWNLDAFHNLHRVRFLHFDRIRLFDGVRNAFLDDLMGDFVNGHCNVNEIAKSAKLFLVFIGSRILTLNRMVHRHMNWIRMWSAEWKLQKCSL